MAGLNKVQLIGYLGRSPELRRTADRTAVATLSLASTRKYKDKAGRAVEDTEWSRVIVWGKLAENCAQFLRKGSLVYIEGRLKTTSWDDKEGVKRWTTDVIAERAQFLDRNPDGGRPLPANDSPGDVGPRDTATPGDNDYLPQDLGGDDDIPF